MQCADEGRLTLTTGRHWATKRADDSARHGAFKPKRRSDSNCRITYHNGIGIPERRCLQSRLVDLDDTNVVGDGPADKLCGYRLLIRELHRNLATLDGFGNHVVVGDDVAVTVEHEPGAGAP